MNKITSSEIFLSLARGRIYSFLAACFRYPDAGSWDEISSDEALSSFAFACTQLSEEKGYRFLGKYSGGLSLGKITSVEKLEEKFQEVFGHTISKQCPPYETEYGNIHLFQQSDVLADLGGFYNAFGLSPTEGKERIDHISIQLEFLYIVSFKEAMAIQEGKIEESEICREVQILFLEEHLGKWAPVFTRRLSLQSKSGIYRKMAALLDKFINAEKKYLLISSEFMPDVTRGEHLPVVSDVWDQSNFEMDADIVSNSFGEK